MDATATASTKSIDSVLLVNYPNKYYVRFREKISDDLRDSILTDAKVHYLDEHIENSLFLIGNKKKLDSFKMFDKNLSNLHMLGNDY